MGEPLRIDIQVVRGLAVLAVILFHAEESLFPNGYLGVDVFFVISGYVITPRLLAIFSAQSVKNKNQLFNDIKTFFLRRFWRLFPALIVILVVANVLLLFLAPFEDQERIGKQGIATIFALGNLGAYKFSGDYFLPNPNPLVHTWSLSIEEQIYLFLPLIMAMWMKFFGKGLRILFAGITCISLAIFVIPSIETQVHQLSGFALEDFGFYSPISRVWEFMVGGLLQYARSNKSNAVFTGQKMRAKYFFNITFFMIVLLFPIMSDRKVMTILAVISTSLVLQFRSFSFLPHRPLKVFQNLGNQSYSTYLIHMPLLYLAKFSPLGAELGQARMGLVILAILITIVFGRLSFKHIEERFRNRNPGEQHKGNFLLGLLPFSVLLFAITFWSAQEGLLANVRYGMNSQVSSMEWWSGCSFLYPKKPLCEFDNDSKQTVLLIGDSHGASISKLIVDLGTQFNFNVVIGTKASCPFLLEKITWDKIDSDCILHNKKIKQFIEENYLDGVIYFQRRLSAIHEGNNLSIKAKKKEKCCLWEKGCREFNQFRN